MCWRVGNRPLLRCSAGDGERGISAAHPSVRGAIGVRRLRTWAGSRLDDARPRAPRSRPRARRLREGRDRLPASLRTHGVQCANVTKRGDLRAVVGAVHAGRHPGRSARRGRRSGSGVGTVGGRGIHVWQGQIPANPTPAARPASLKCAPMRAPFGIALADLIKAMVGATKKQMSIRPRARRRCWRLRCSLSCAGHPR